MANEKIKEENENKKNDEEVDSCPCLNKETAGCCLGSLPISWS
jgi:hypothetical protein